MKKAILFSLQFCLAALAFDPRATAVKIVSKDEAANRQFMGSGVLFRKDGQVYTLTSDHVFLHCNDKCSHKVSSAKLGEKTAHYLVSNWAIGLGLLQIDGVPPDYDLPTYDQLNPPEVKQGDKVTLIGYPIESTSVIVDKRGHVDQPAFPSPLFVDVRQLIHVVEAHGEFGMSGGPLYSADGRFLGNLSHQILKDAPVPQNDLLIIPATAAYQWLGQYFADPKNYESPFVEPPQIQYRSEPEICAHDLWYTYLQAYGYEAGFEVSISLLGQTLSEKSPPDPSGFLERVSKFLKANPNDVADVAVFSFRHKGDFWSSETETFGTLPEFFRLLARADLEPTTITNINFVDKYLEPAHKLAGDLDQAMEPFRYLAGGPGSLLVNRLTFLGYRLAGVAPGRETYQYGRVKPSDLRNLLDGPEYADEWKALREKADYAVDRLRDDLKKLIPLFEKLTV